MYYLLSLPGCRRDSKKSPMPAAVPAAWRGSHQRESAPSYSSCNQTDGRQGSSWHAPSIATLSHSHYSLLSRFAMLSTVAITQGYTNEICCTCTPDRWRSTSWRAVGVPSLWDWASRRSPLVSRHSSLPTSNTATSRVKACPARHTSSH